MLLLPGIMYLSANSIIDVGSSTDLFGSISRQKNQIWHMIAQITREQSEIKNPV